MEPLHVLRRVFLTQLVDLESLAVEGDPSRLLAGLVTVLAGISFALTAPLALIDGLPQESLWGMEHFLIASTMTVTGLFALMSWESIFPEKKDILVLGPLPISNRTIFGGRVLALAWALMICVLALNCFTGLGWVVLFEPAHGGFTGLLRSMLAYWVTTLVAAAFVFCSVLSLHGIASLTLPRQLFLRISGALQMLGFVTVIADFFLEPSLAPFSRNAHLLGRLPSYWFSSLFLFLNGSSESTIHSTVMELAGKALFGLGVAFVGGVLAVLVAYRRLLPRIVEDPDIRPMLRGFQSGVHRGNLPQLAIRSFAWRTLLRSRLHRLMSGFFLALGMVAVLLVMRVPAASSDMGRDGGLFAATLVALAISISGMRVVLSIPVFLKANWIFQVAELETAKVYEASVRSAFFGMAVLPVCVASLIAGLWMHAGSILFIHLAVLLLMGKMLVEIAVVTFHRLPFASPWLPGRANMAAIFFGGIMLGVPLAIHLARYESALLRQRGGWAWLLAGLLCVTVIVLWVVPRFVMSFSSHDGSVDFDPHEEPLLVSLKLNGSA